MSYHKSSPDGNSPLFSFLGSFGKNWWWTIDRLAPWSAHTARMMDKLKASLKWFDLEQNTHGVQIYPPSNFHFHSIPIQFEGHLKSEINGGVGWELVAAGIAWYSWDTNSVSISEDFIGFIFITIFYKSIIHCSAPQRDVLSNKMVFWVVTHSFCFILCQSYLLSTVKAWRNWPTLFAWHETLSTSCPCLLVSPPPISSNISCLASTFYRSASKNVFDWDQKHFCLSASKCCLFCACLPVSPCRVGYWRNWQAKWPSSKYLCWANNAGQFRQAFISFLYKDKWWWLILFISCFASLLYWVLS